MACSRVTFTFVVDIIQFVQQHRGRIVSSVRRIFYRLEKGNRNLIQGKKKICLLSKSKKNFCGPPIPLFKGYLEQNGRCVKLSFLHKMSRLEVPDFIPVPPLPYATSCRAEGQFYFLFTFSKMVLRATCVRGSRLKSQNGVRLA